MKTHKDVCIRGREVVAEAWRTMGGSQMFTIYHFLTVIVYLTSHSYRNSKGIYEKDDFFMKRMWENGGLKFQR